MKAENTLIVWRYQFIGVVPREFVQKLSKPRIFFHLIFKILHVISVQFGLICVEFGVMVRF